MKKRCTAFMVSLPPFLGGCQTEGGKNIFDAVQVMFHQDAGTRWVFSIFLVIVCWQMLKIVGFLRRWIWTVIKAIKPVLFRWRPRNLVVATLLGTLVFGLNGPISDVIQELEQRFFSPVWLGQYNDVDEAHLLAIYESELAKKVDSYELGIIKQRTAETAEKIQSSSLAIYECAYLECGLNPFIVRSDKVAAGWIQFTRAGLGGINYEGQPVTFDQVLYACQQRNIKLMMDISEIYLNNKFHQAGKIPLRNTVDLYLALFAPAYIGGAHDKVIYKGWDNPSYYLNKGLDGWYVQVNAEGKNQIFRKDKACDGAITIWEIYLALEAKKGRLTHRYLHR